MKAKITNNSKAPQGVHTEAGLVFIQPGRSRTLTVADDVAERLGRQTKLFRLEEHDDSKVETGADGGGDVIPTDFDAMDDDALREFITGRDGKAPHHALGREKLLAKAREEPAAS